MEEIYKWNIYIEVYKIYIIKINVISGKNKKYKEKERNADKIAKKKEKKKMCDYWKNCWTEYTHLNVAGRLTSGCTYCY